MEWRASSGYGVAAEGKAGANPVGSLDMMDTGADWLR